MVSFLDEFIYPLKLFMNTKKGCDFFTKLFTNQTKTYNLRISTLWWSLADRKTTWRMSRYSVFCWKEWERNRGSYGTALAYGRSHLVFIWARWVPSVTLIRWWHPICFHICNSWKPHFFNSARLYVVGISLNRFEEANVNILPWSARSPDLLPIALVWDNMGIKLVELANPQASKARTGNTISHVSP